jgi:hypothetical protein
MTTRDREIIARLEKIGGGDAARGFGLLCVTACICPACGESWDNPAYPCGCMNAIRTNEANTPARGSRP